MRCLKPIVTGLLTFQLSVGPVLAQPVLQQPSPFQTRTATGITNLRITSQNADGTEVVLTMEYGYDGALGGPNALVVPVIEKRGQKGVAAWFGADPVTIGGGRGTISIKVKYFNDEPGVPPQFASDSVRILILNRGGTAILSSAPFLKTIKWGGPDAKPAPPATVTQVPAKDESSAGALTAHEKLDQEASRLAERKQRQEAERVAREEARLQAEAEAKRLAAEKQIADAKVREEAKAREEARRQAAAGAKARRAAEEKARTEAKAREAEQRKAEAETKRLAEVARKAEEKAQTEARSKEKARLAAEAKAREEARAKAEAEAKRLAEDRKKAEALAQAEAEAREKARLAAEAEEKARQEAERIAKTEADARETARVKAEAEAKRLAQEKRLAEEQAKATAAESALAEAARLKAEAKRQADDKARATTPSPAESTVRKETPAKPSAETPASRMAASERLAALEPLATNLKTKITNVDVVNRTLDRSQMTIGVEFEYRDNLGPRPMLGVDVTKFSEPEASRYFSSNPAEIGKSRRNFVLFPIKFQPSGTLATLASFSTDNLLVYLAEATSVKRFNLYPTTMLLTWRAPGAALSSSQKAAPANRLELEDFKQNDRFTGYVTVRYNLINGPGKLRVRLFDAANPASADWFAVDPRNINAGQGMQIFEVALAFDAITPGNVVKVDTLRIDLIDSAGKVVDTLTREKIPMTWAKLE